MALCKLARKECPLCKERGHWIFTCPQVICGICGATGHNVDCHKALREARGLAYLYAHGMLCFKNFEHFSNVKFDLRNGGSGVLPECESCGDRQRGEEARKKLASFIKTYYEGRFKKIPYTCITDPPAPAGWTMRTAIKKISPHSNSNRGAPRQNQRPPNQRGSMSRSNSPRNHGRRFERSGGRGNNGVRIPASAYNLPPPHPPSHAHPPQTNPRLNRSRSSARSSGNILRSGENNMNGNIKNPNGSGSRSNPLRIRTSEQKSRRSSREVGNTDNLRRSANNQGRERANHPPSGRVNPPPPPPSQARVTPAPQRRVPLSSRPFPPGTYCIVMQRHAHSPDIACPVMSPPNTVCHIQKRHNHPEGTPCPLLPPPIRTRSHRAPIIPSGGTAKMIIDISEDSENEEKGSGRRIRSGNKRREMAGERDPKMGLGERKYKKPRVVIRVKEGEREKEKEKEEGEIEEEDGEEEEQVDEDAVPSPSPPPPPKETYRTKKEGNGNGKGGKNQ